MTRGEAIQAIREAEKKVKVEPGYLDTHYSRFLYLAQRFGKLRNKKVLELGCYPMFLFWILRVLGAEVFGIAGPHQKVRARNVKIVDLNQGKIPFKHEFFDLVVFSEVLEHLYCSPLKILREIKRVLRSNGRCILTTPNATSSLNRFKLLFGINVFARMESILDEKDGVYAACHWHHREYTMRELKNLADQTEFKVGRSEYFTSAGPFRPGKKPLLRKMAQLVNLALATICPPLSDTIYLELIKE